MYKKIILTFLITVLMIFLLSACSTTSSKENKAGVEGGPFTIQIANMSGSGVLELAKQKGWLEEELAKINGKVEWTQFTSGPPIIEAIFAKRADFGTLGEGAVLTAISSKADVKFLSLQSDGLKGINYLIVPKGSDIKQLSDLKGKQIGVGKGTSLHVFLTKVLKTAGLEQSDVELINLQVLDAQPAFQSGQLDAWVAPDPLVFQEVNVNGASIITSGELLNIKAPTLYFTRGEFAKIHPEAVDIFLQVIQKATDYLKDNTDEATKVLADSSQTPPAIINLLTANAQSQNSPISGEIIKELQSSADTLLELGYLKNKIDLEPFIDSTYINKLNK